MKTFVTVSVVAGCVLTLATVVPAAEPTQSARGDPGRHGGRSARRKREQDRADDHR